MRTAAAVALMAIAAFLLGTLTVPLWHWLGIG